jgi:hypothetical protein
MSDYSGSEDDINNIIENVEDLDSEDELKSHPSKHFNYRSRL